MRSAPQPPKPIDPADDPSADVEASLRKVLAERELAPHHLMSRLPRSDAETLLSLMRIASTELAYRWAELDWNAHVKRLVRELGDGPTGTDLPWQRSSDGARVLTTTGRVWRLATGRIGKPRDTR